MRTRELLTMGVSLFFLGELSKLAIGSRKREWLKSQRIDVEDKGCLEIHHQKERRNGGGDEDENLVPLTRVEHAKTHYDRAVSSTDWGNASAEYWAVSAITRRMTAEEIRQLNAAIKKR